MLLKTKVKMYMRQKIIAIYLDNYIKLNNGTLLDEWGSNWIEKSYNDVLSSFRNNEKNEIFQSKINLLAMAWATKIEDDFIYAPLYVLHKVYFDKEPNIKELNKLRFEYKVQKDLRNINI